MILPQGVAVTQFIEDSNRLDNEALMNKYSVSARTIRRWKQRIKESEEEILATSFPESPSPVYDNYLRFNSERLMILGDVEMPSHDSDLLNMAIDLAIKLDIPDLIINGDFLAMDEFSTWAKTNYQSNSFRQDLELLKSAINIFIKEFDTVTYITGNHERRLARQTNGELNIGMLLSMVDINYSDYTYCEVTSGGKEFIICHPEDYSRTPLAVPLKLAAIHHKNILCGHTHRLASGFDVSGKYIVAEGGFLRDPKRTLYKSMKLTSHPAWNAGFTILVGGHLFLINRQNYNFFMNCVDLDSLFS